MSDRTGRAHGNAYAAPLRLKDFADEMASVVSKAAKATTDAFHNAR
jgi:hypothetical protein